MGLRKLLIDDLRDLKGVDAIARTAEMAKCILNGPHHFDLVYMDHDLGPGESGMDLLRWMFDRFIYPSAFILVTNNPAGLRNMRAELRARNYVCVCGVWRQRREN